MICASCESTMSRRQGPTGRFWMCDQCGSRLATMGFLHKSLERAPLSRLWQDARAGRGCSGRDCPSCRRSMQEIPLLLEPEEAAVGQAALLDIDVCPSCHLVFFDADELEQLPVQPVGLKRRERAPVRHQSPRSDAPLPAMDPLLEAKLEQIKREGGASVDLSGPKMLLSFLVPVEVDAPAVSTVPVVTWATAALMVLTAIVTFGDLGPAVADWGYVPSDPLRNGGLTLITSFLLHGGVGHLLGNLWFLLLFGDNVEDLLGTRRYLAVLGGAALLGIVLHTMADPTSTVPLVGASGGISGLMLLYAARFPHAKLGMTVFFFLIPKFFTLPAFLYMTFWVSMQLLGTFASMGTSGAAVSYLAHLGGAIVGVLAWWFWARGD